MNSNLRKTYVTYLRSVTVATVLAVATSVVIRNYYLAITWV